MKTLDVASATEPLKEYVRQLQQEPLVLTEDGEPVAALALIDLDDLETLALGSNPKFLALLEAARAQRRSGMGLSSTEVRQALGLD